MIGLALKKGKEVGRKSVIPITFSLFYAGFEILFSFVFLFFAIQSWHVHAKQNPLRRRKA